MVASKSPQIAKFGAGKALCILVDAKSTTEVLAATAKSYVGAIAAKFTWAQTEPYDGDFNWSAIDKLISMRRNKGVCIHLGSCGVPNGGPSATPAWLFEDRGAPAALTPVQVGQPLPVPRPIFWDRTYLDLVKRWLGAFAAKYGASRAIELVRITGLASDGSGEPGGYNELNSQLGALWASAGIAFNGRKPTFTGADPYSLAVLELINFAADVLPNHRIETVFHFPGLDQTTVGLDQAMVDLAAKRRLVLTNPGLNDHDKSDSRERLASYRTAGAQVGWASITNVTQNDPTAWPRMAVEATGNAEHLPVPGVSYVYANAKDVGAHDADLATISANLTR